MQEFSQLCQGGSTSSRGEAGVPGPRSSAADVCAPDPGSLPFQDLLQMQYEGVAVMKMFDKVKVNVNLLIYLLNKKFYGK